MPTIHDQRNRLVMQSNLYDRKIKSNKDSKRLVEKKIGSFRKKKNEANTMASFYRNKFEKARKFNDKFNYMKLILISAATSVLKIAQIILGIFSLGGFLNIPVVIMYVMLALAMGTKIISEVIESKNKNKYENEERTSKTYDLQINKLEKELGNYLSDIKTIEQKKMLVDNELHEIDEYLRSLDVDFEKMQEQNLDNGMSNVEEVPSGPKF